MLKPALPLLRRSYDSSDGIIVAPNLDLVSASLSTPVEQAIANRRDGQHGPLDRADQSQDYDEDQESKANRLAGDRHVAHFEPA